MDFTVTLFEHGKVDEMSDGVSYHPPINVDRRIFGCEIDFTEPITPSVFFALQRCLPCEKQVELGARTGPFRRRERNEITVPQGSITTMSPTKMRVSFATPWRSEDYRNRFLEKASPILTTT